MKRQLIVAVLLAGAFSVGAQNYSDPNIVAVPSVNNKFFVSNTLYDVSLYAGTQAVNIPIYTMSSKDISIPISLRYLGARGIKVQDAANYVGLGWILDASGQISRVVRGLPDDQNKGYIGMNKSGPQIVSAASSGTVSSDLLSQIGQGQIDGEPDIFYVKTPFFNFQFVFDENGNAVFPNNTGFRINQNINAGGGWTVTDDKGNKYVFGSSSVTRETTTTKLYDQDKTFVGSWYLEKIIMYNNTDEINFSYTAGPDYSLKHYMTCQTVVTGYGVSGESNTTTKDLTATLTYNSPKYLSQITTSMGEVTFGYLFDRRDIINAARLTDITVYPYDPANATRATAVKKYEFGYTYFGDPSSNPEALRLKLDHINQYGNSIAVPPIRLKSFYYETTINLPPRNSVEFDYWGYYNVNPSGTAFIPDANKSPDAARTKANVLTAVEDISGERLEFLYELNKYHDAAAGNTDVGGLRISRISKKLPSGENHYTQYVYEHDNGNSTGEIVNSNYKMLSREVLNYLIMCWNGVSWAVCGVTMANITISENLYNTYDLNGIFVGYSQVKVVHQNGGYEVSHFNNFSQFPDAEQMGTGYQTSSLTSLAYKRGLLAAKKTHIAEGHPVSETVNGYNSLESAVVKKAYGITPIPIYANNTAWSITWSRYHIYSTNIENYVLTSTTERTFDQTNQSLYQETVSNYTYSPNKRLVHQVLSTDSKGDTKSKILYYPENTSIPGLGGYEQAVINDMKDANNTSAVIHTVETNNQNSINTHNTYLNFLDVSSVNKALLGNKRTYINYNTDEVSVQQFQYDINNAKVTAVNKKGGPFQSTLFGYHDGYIKAKVSNALNTSSMTFWRTSQTDIIQYDQDHLTQSVPISVSGGGDVVLTVSTGSSSSTYVLFEYTLIGPTQFSGNLCSSTNNTCSNNSQVTITNVPPGNYTLYTSVSTNTGGGFTGSINATYTIPLLQKDITSANEFFYDGFEETSGMATATPFAGKRYFHGSYTVPFVKPNARVYQVDYHYLLNGKWYAATKPYQDNIVLNDGMAVDEVRVYPADAQMTTYTYDPFIGMTSVGDQRNRFTFYEYDAFGRLKLVRDNDRNIIKRYDYVYQTTLAQTCPRPEISNITSAPFSITVSYYTPIGCTGISYTIREDATGVSVTRTAGRIGPAISESVWSKRQYYTVTVTSYSAECPQGVSDSRTIYVP